MDNGKTVKCTEEGHRLGKMVQSSLVITLKGKKKGKESSRKLMGTNTVDSGKMIYLLTEKMTRNRLL